MKNTQQVRDRMWLDLTNNFMTNLIIASICLFIPTQKWKYNDMQFDEFLYRISF